MMRPYMIWPIHWCVAPPYVKMCCTRTLHVWAPIFACAMGFFLSVFLSFFPSVISLFRFCFFLFIFFGGPHSIYPRSYVQKPYRTCKWGISHTTVDSTRRAWMGYIMYEHVTFSRSIPCSFRRRNWELALGHGTTTIAGASKMGNGVELLKFEPLTLIPFQVLIRHWVPARCTLIQLYIHFI